MTKLFQKHYYLIDRVALSIKRRGKYNNLELDDIKQIAGFSLWDSAKRFKDGIVPFPPYAVQRMKFAISDEGRKKQLEKIELDSDIISININEEYFSYYWQWKFVVENQNTLTDREKEVINLILSGLSDQDIAKKINLCAERVRQIKMHAIEKLKKEWKNRGET